MTIICKFVPDVFVSGVYYRTDVGITLCIVLEEEKQYKHDIQIVSSSDKLHS